MTQSDQFANDQQHTRTSKDPAKYEKMLAIQAQTDIESNQKIGASNSFSPRSIDVNNRPRYQRDLGHSSGGPFNNKPPISDKYLRDRHDNLP